MQGDAPAPPSTRNIPARRLASVREELYQADVGAFLQRTFTRLFDFTNAHPGLRSPHPTPESPTYALYHGTFGFDGPTPVEACVVLDRDVALDEVDPMGQITVRVEPAHLEAFLPLTRRHLALPALGPVYDELGAWVETHGRMLAHIPPREVYITNVMSAGEDDYVCDVAFPFEARS